MTGDNWNDSTENIEEWRPIQIFQLRSNECHLHGTNHYQESHQLNLKKRSLVITGKVPICITTCDVERSSVMTGKVLEGQQ